MITSQQNNQIKYVRKLARPRFREQQGEFVVEGVRLIEDALRANIVPRRIFYCEATASVRAQQLLARLHARAVETLACTESVFNGLSETVTPQGVVALFSQPNLPLPERPSCLLLLDQLRDPGNAGTLLRSAEAAGADGLLCCPGTVDPFNPKVVRAAMGAHFRLPLRVLRTWDEVVSELRSIEGIYVADATGAAAYTEVDWARPSAVIIGGEAEGASARARELAVPVRIPMAGAVESLNAGVAGALILFEIARQRQLSVR